MVCLLCVCVPGLTFQDKTTQFHLPYNDLALGEVLNCTGSFPLGDEILQTTV